jgi:signal transduction histidine kinase
VFRDLSQARQTESELREARRLAERAANAKADVLARISHEVRTPLNAIIGFSEVMIGERFGALGNERYLEYMKDIRASGERVIAIINDLLDLSGSKPASSISPSPTRTSTNWSRAASRCCSRRPTASASSSAPRWRTCCRP